MPVRGLLFVKAKLHKTYSPTQSDLARSWYVVDATGVPLGRLASEVAQILRGKHKPTYAPHLDGGDHVIIVNAAKVHASGNKETEKVYYRHSGYPGGLRAETFSQVRRDHPERLVESAVRGMLPKNRLGRQMFRKLKVYPGPEHPHAAQQPEPMTLTHRKADS
ncbi:MAG: 50S ribosomal protein L13 [Acidimicrobiia bacterium]